MDSVEETETEKLERLRREKKKTYRRYAIIGTVSAIGGVLVGLTGGLAAPLFATGLAAIIGGSAAAGIATVTGAAVLGSLFGVAGAGLTGYKIKRRVGELTEFTVETLSPEKDLSCVLAISGWVVEDSEDAFRWPWRHLAMSDEQYCLRYETKEMLALGNAIKQLYSAAVTYAVKQTLMETALAGLLSAMTWPASILALGNVIANPWNVCVSRADKAGEHVAHLLLARRCGRRPITLIGFSLGARIIHKCLSVMARHDSSKGIVQDVYLLGAPVTGDKGWDDVCDVVAGRLVNGFSRKDWILSFVYRTLNLQHSVAGLRPVARTKKKLANVDLSDVVEGHLDYYRKSTEVLKAIGVKVNGDITAAGSSLFLTGYLDEVEISGNLPKAESDTILATRTQSPQDLLREPSKDDFDLRDFANRSE